MEFYNITKLESLKTHYESIKFFTYENEPYSINHAYLASEFAWLFSHIQTDIHNKTYHITHLDPCYKVLSDAKYSKLLIYIVQFPRIYSKMTAYLDENTPGINPDFIQRAIAAFDKYMVHSCESDDVFYNNWKEYYDILLFLFYKIINHLDEIEFEYFALKSLIIPNLEIV